MIFLAFPYRRPLLKGQWAVAYACTTNYHKLILMQATAERVMGGGFRRNSDSELKLENRCTGSTIYNIQTKGMQQWRIQDFPEEGAPTPQGARQHTILLNFPKNYIKLKEFGPPGGGGGGGARASLVPPLEPPLYSISQW